MQEIAELNEEFEKSEARKNELEKQIDLMREDLMNAQKSLSRLEQFETEKIRLKEDLELKIEEFNMLTEHYQHEKERYIHVLEQVQGQVNIYKEKSQKFDTETGSWSKQIDALKAELMESQATLVKMDELEQKNEKLRAELHEKEIEIYKIKKENERALNLKLDQFRREMNLQQDKIAQFGRERENWEKQFQQMKAQISVLESSLEEKESFIKQFIRQPLSQTNSFREQGNINDYQLATESQEVSSQKSSDENQNSQLTHPPTQPTPNLVPEASNQQPSQPMPKPVPEASNQQPRQPTTQNKQDSKNSSQPSDWFLRMMSMQQGSRQPAVPKSTGPASPSMDFFTLRSKTTQAAVPPSNGNQWN